MATAINMLPDSAKKLRELYLTKGMGAVQEVTERAIAAGVNDNVFRMDELPNVKPPEVKPIGIPLLDDHYRIRLGDFTVVTGIPSHGKSSFINEVCGRMAVRYGWSTTFASFEQMPQIDHRRNLRTFFNQKLVVHQSPEEIDKADAWINRYFSFIVPREEDETVLAWLFEAVEASVRRHKTQIVVVDPWNELDHIYPPGMSLTQYTGLAIKYFKRLARDLNVHLIVAAHPTKQKKLEGGGYDIPTLYDISDSAHWYNKADCGIVIHRKDGATTIIRVAKSRYHDQIGTPGDVLANFNRETNRYQVIEPEMRQYER